jgi:hypothetical protein
MEALRIKTIMFRGDAYTREVDLINVIQTLIITQPGMKLETFLEVYKAGEETGE